MSCLQHQPHRIEVKSRRGLALDVRWKAKGTQKVCMDWNLDHTLHGCKGHITTWEPPMDHVMPEQKTNRIRKRHVSLSVTPVPQS